MERIGRYEILAELGRGAMGVVYKARDPKIGREVAIKTIRLSDKVDRSEVTSLRERLFREAQSAGRLSHPGIVTIYDIEEQDDLAYISMELVDGRTLERIIINGEAGDLAFVGQVMRLSAAALDYAHSRDIIHRDVKPANLMITSDGRVKITDFGIARISSSQLTQTGTVMGTPSYMSPEQVKGDPLDGRSDQFSLAVIAYEMLTGQKPFAGENLTSVMFKIVSETPVEPMVLNPSIPSPVQDTLLKALSKNPSDRYPACAVFAASLMSQIEATQAMRSGTGAAREADETAHGGLDLGATAPAMRTLKIEDPGETRLAGSPAGLRPLSSRPHPSDATTGQAAARPRAGRGAAWVWPAAAVLILGAPILLALLNPWLLDDPSGLVRALLRPDAVHQGMQSSIALLLEKNNSPLPPAELTQPIEQAFRQRQRAARAQLSGQEPSGQETVPPPAPVEPQTAAAEPPAAGSETAAQPPEKTAAPVTKQQASSPRAPAAPRLVAVKLTATAQGAQVVVDRNPQWSCVAPCSLELPRGRHVAVASLAGFRSYPKIFEVGSDPADVEIQMREITGTLLISSEPSGAEVFVDGRRVQGATNLQFDAAPGYHVILVRKTGSGTAERSVSVQEGGLHPVHFILRSEGVARGRLVVRSEPAGADVVVNDRQRVGTTPAEVDLPPGNYRVAVSRSGYRPVIREIELAPGQPQNLDVTLSPQN
jgi:serine/threonine-protein kinase